MEKSKSEVKISHAFTEMATTTGLTLYIRKSTGMTRLLQQHASLLSLLDGPYPNNPPAAVLNSNRLLLIGGGIGITGLPAFINAHVNVKIAWSVKQADQALAAELDVAVRSGVDHEVRIGERLNVRGLLPQEIVSGYKKIGVVVCGPPALCDDVRALVSSLGRHEKVELELEVDAFAW
jgi:predicted ferric reductase